MTEYEKDIKHNIEEKRFIKKNRNHDVQKSHMHYHNSSKFSSPMAIQNGSAL